MEGRSNRVILGYFTRSLLKTDRCYLEQTVLELQRYKNIILYIDCIRRTFSPKICLKGLAFNNGLFH